jgi:hypothetical protein
LKCTLLENLFPCLLDFDPCVQAFNPADCRILEFYNSARQTKSDLQSFFHAWFLFQNFVNFYVF